MDVGCFKNMVAEEDYLQHDADFDGSALEGERCGICMDVVIDRGVLDCCQHWFCFACIDNWSTITNLCPLCQNEFQMITCVPVYDTIGSKRDDEDSSSRDDEWSVEGKTSTLSFPSYYIDENAVTCLDDGCRIRSGSITLDESSSLDTSIACDSCDIWYHAFCVGFDPEGPSVELWLCPRCLTTETPGSGMKSQEAVKFDNHLKNYEYAHQGADILSGKVSVSVADDGETALVVSMVDHKHLLEEPSASTSVFNKEQNFSPTVSGSVSPSSKYEEISKDQIKSPQSKMVGASDAVMTSLYGEQSLESEIKNEIMCRSSSSEASEVPSIDFCKSSNETEPKADTCENSDHVSSVACPLNDNDDGILVEHLGRDSSADGINAKAELSARIHGKRKRKDHGEFSDCAMDQKKLRLQTDALPCKIKSDEAAQRTVVTSELLEHDSLPIISASDIMSIVQDTESSLAGSNKVDLLEGKKDMAGIRMKKIVRRPAEDKDSFSLVQKLRKEIREAVKNKSSQDVGQSIFDPKLLAAFRTAVTVPEAESGKRVSSMVKAKNMMFRKGRTRESLTKKIFSTASGKRKHDWHRDCQVEFWRRRCVNKTANPEKIETLKSVLNLLKTGPNPALWEQNIEEEGTNPILSRLYLADASVLPRKNNAKPLSTVEDCARAGESQVSTLAEKEVKLPSDIHKTGNQDRIMTSIQSDNSSSDGTKRKSTPSRRSGVASSSVGESIVDTQKLKVGKSDEVIDKRKWALEILARKTSTTMNQKQEGDAALKGKHPLLALLPGDMKPSLAPCRHKNIPNSVRQAQLYRLAEHFLKLTNVSPMRKTGATELAVADAINIEKEVANKSNSKLVYLNLVSQELRNRPNTIGSNLAEDTNPSASETISPGGVDTSGPLSLLDPEVEEALRNAGLLFDSPPNSPNHQADKPNEKEGTSVVAKREEDERTNDILEMNPNPEIDIYGDFEYDLDDDDYIAATTAEVSNLKNKEEDESKVKVVFSTHRTNSGLDSVNAETHEHPKDEKADDSLQLPHNSTDEGGGDQEASVDEYEELYGPDKELPLCEKFPSEALASQTLESHALPPQGMKPSLRDESEKVTTRTSNGNDPGGISEGGNLQNDSRRSEKKKSSADKEHGAGDSILKKVEAYIKEHLRPLCKSGIITVDQYRWAVAKTAEKVMKYHSKAKNATFLIKEGEKVKKLAEQYVEAAAQKKQESK